MQRKKKMAHDSRKIYLGDGVYAEHDPANMIRLWTSDGFRETNEIFLEPEVWLALQRYVQKIWKHQNA